MNRTPFVLGWRCEPSAGFMERFVEGLPKPLADLYRAALTAPPPRVEGVKRVKRKRVRNKRIGMADRSK